MLKLEKLDKTELLRISFSFVNVSETESSFPKLIYPLVTFTFDVYVRTQNLHISSCFRQEMFERKNLSNVELKTNELPHQCYY